VISSAYGVFVKTYGVDWKTRRLTGFLLVEVVLVEVEPQPDFNFRQPRGLPGTRGCLARVA